MTCPHHYTHSSAPYLVVVFCNSMHSRCSAASKCMMLEPPALVGKSSHLIGLGRHCWVYLFTSIQQSRLTSFGLPVYIWYSFYFLFWLDLNGRFCLASASRTVFFIIEALIALTAVMVTRIYVELLRNTLHINVIHKFFFHFSNCFFTSTAFIFQSNRWVTFYLYNPDKNNVILTENREGHIIRVGSHLGIVLFIYAIYGLHHVTVAWNLIKIDIIYNKVKFYKRKVYVYKATLIQ